MLLASGTHCPNLIFALRMNSPLISCQKLPKHTLKIENGLPAHKENLYLLFSGLQFCH